MKRLIWLRALFKSSTPISIENAGETEQKNSINPLNKSILFQQYSDSLKKGVPFYISIHKYKDRDLIEESSSGVGINKEYFKDYINSIDIDFDIQ